MSKIKLSDIYLPAYKEFHQEYKLGKKTFFVLKGGRGSGKSSHISIEIILDMMKNPLNFLVVRKVKNTLEESVFEQLKWAINLLKVDHLWKVNKSPLRLTYIPRGNEIIFRGADDPGKIKSIKKSNFPIARMWIEELDEFLIEDDVDKIVNSIIREELPTGLSYKIIYSYNPPKRKQSWINKKYDSVMLQSNYFKLHTTYLDNKFMSKAFVIEAEHVKETNLKKYNWVYMGYAIGSGVVPFENVTFREITNQEIKTFNNIKQGLDWGYAVDPAHFGRWHYDKTRRRLYAIAEIHEVKISNRRLSERILEKKYHDHVITCDSAEPKSVDEVRSYGLRARGALKGPGSVEYGEKWLDDLEEIIIDPRRTPATAREFENIDYEVDRLGNVRSKLEDKDNHSIDALRYALEDEMKNKRSAISGDVVKG